MAYHGEQMLTSFKTAHLVSKLPFIEKVLFVVDRKDLDYQTKKEYDKFEKRGCPQLFYGKQREQPQ